MVELIDTHAHLYAEQFDEDVEDVLLRAKESGVSRVYLPNIDQDYVERLKSLYRAHEDFLRPMMGLHPCSVKDDYLKVLEGIRKEFDQKEINYVAVGEIGLDLYWDKSTKDIQIDAFKIQCQWAKDLNLPIAIHSRDATTDLIEILEKEDYGIKGVFHCFGGTLEEARRIIDLDFKLGIGGVVTFKNSGLDKVVKDIELKHLILETDAPYLAPAPHRGKRNETSYIKLVAQKLSDIYNLSLNEIAQETSRGARELFGD